MGRKSSLDKLPKPVIEFIQQLLRENRLTISELLDEVNNNFPELENKPSRSALGRFSQNFNKRFEEHNKFKEMANIYVSQLGENTDDKTGMFLAQSLTMLLSRVTMEQLDKDDNQIIIKEAGLLAKAALDIQRARELSLKERLAIEEEARKRLLREQQDNLEKTAKAQGLSADYVDLLKREVLGVN
ncbi:DUF3486 family protein [Entomomonas sp. E2T0]|uniref:DUF3486 family protein n=1 Tax=Entomomonas sp. E2T0 TaxID=2930213 RepID=UPI0022283FE5|nr:DUF3486 family protein [Entomomonas sp. E2T0]UYZ84296.1 DUF3486 family protein [Entomomonas sp. E2T0]